MTSSQKNPGLFTTRVEWRLRRKAWIDDAVEILRERIVSAIRQAQSGAPIGALCRMSRRRRHSWLAAGNSPRFFRRRRTVFAPLQSHAPGVLPPPGCGGQAKQVALTAWMRKLLTTGPYGATMRNDKHPSLLYKVKL